MTKTLRPLRYAAEVLYECGQGNFGNASEALARLEQYYADNMGGQLRVMVEALRHPQNQSSEELSLLSQRLHYLAGCHWQ